MNIQTEERDNEFLGKAMTSKDLPFADGRRFEL